MLTPGYGETPLGFDELDALVPDARAALGDPIARAAVYDLEQAIQDEATEDLLTRVLEDDLTPGDLLSDRFVRDRHSRLYRDIWNWAGRFRRRELNIGVAPAQVAVELRSALATIRHRWAQTNDWSPHTLGIAAHAETVRVHPFTDGNGRTTRLLGDLVFVAAQDSRAVEVYDWRLDKRRYVELLRRYDVDRDPRALAVLIGTRPLGHD